MPDSPIDFKPVDAQSNNVESIDQSNIENSPIDLKPISKQTTTPNQGGFVSNVIKGLPYGALRGTSNILSTGGQAAEIEMGQPISVPSPLETFDLAQRNITGTIMPGLGLGGKLGRNIGETLPYLLTNPSTAGVFSRLLQSGLIGGGATAGEEATKGTSLEPYGGLAGAIAAPGAASLAIKGTGNLLSGIAGKSTESMLPSKDEIFQAGSDAFNKARSLKAQFDPNTVSDISNLIKTDLKQDGRTEIFAPKTHATLDSAINNASGQPLTVDDLLGFRKQLQNAQGSIEPQEKAAATIAKHSFDEMLGNLPDSYVMKGDAGQVTSLLDTGRKNWAAAERMETADTRIANAELRASTRNSGMNASNLIRSKLADILLSPKLSAGWSPESLEQARTAAQGTTLGNTARYTKNFMGGGGGLGGLVTSVAGNIVTGSPLGLGVGPVVGTAAHIAENLSTNNQLSKLRAILASESPLAQSRMPIGRSTNTLQKLTNLGSAAAMPPPLQALFAGQP